MPVASQHPSDLIQYRRVDSRPMRLYRGAFTATFELAPKVSAYKVDTPGFRIFSKPREGSQSLPRDAAIYDKTRFINSLHRGPLGVVQARCDDGGWFELREPEMLTTVL